MHSTNHNDAEELWRLALLLRRGAQGIVPVPESPLRQLLLSQGLPALPFPLPLLQHPLQLAPPPLLLSLPQQQLRLHGGPRAPQIAPPPARAHASEPVLRAIGKTGQYIDVLSLAGIHTIEDDDSEHNRFPSKLHRLLHDASTHKWEHIVGFEDHGRAFRIRNREAFSVLVSKYFKQTKISSFQRQLNLWGFRLIRQGKDEGCCYHPLFLKSHPQLCTYMSRMGAKSEGRKRMDAQPHPNFQSLRRG